MGREGDIAGKGAFSGRGGVKKCLLSGDAGFVAAANMRVCGVSVCGWGAWLLGTVGGVFVARGEFAGEMRVGCGGMQKSERRNVRYLPMPYLSRRRSKMRAAGLTKISRNTAFDSM